MANRRWAGMGLMRLTGGKVDTFMAPIDYQSCLFLLRRFGRGGQRDAMEVGEAHLVQDLH